MPPSPLAISIASYYDKYNPASQIEPGESRRYDGRMMQGEDVREWRARHGLTQYELAELLGVRSVQVSRWERGANRPAGRLLELALKGLEVELPEAREGEQPS
jgi:DNA-binding transcriptional regulator YiaG